MTENSADNVDLTWKLDKMTEVPGIIAACLVTVDGIKLAYSNASVDDVDRAAAALAGLRALGANLTGLSGKTADETKVRRVTLDLKSSTILLFTAGTNSVLGVAVEGDEVSPAVTVATGMALKTIASFGESLAAAERAVAHREQQARMARASTLA
ncbi:roadblock/LC7 domain-containing protein [Streptomyces sp. NPDC047525]|uniref:roadblock/LC7 domain-containing protein n=1 Tax=Streptomyces sp. NPDC047525 TaxID=3155264 RepID=UPI0033F6AD43